MNALAIPALFFGLFSVDGDAYSPVAIDDKSYSVLIADTPFEQMRGLMGHTSLAADQGMLFVYSKERSVKFWMKNVTLPLDMIFLDDCGEVTQIHENARPGDETIIPSDGPVRAVLELRGGASKRDHIRVGDHLKADGLQIFDTC